MHDEERNGRLSIITDDLVELVRERIMENHRFTIMELTSHFPQISRYLLHKIVTEICCSENFVPDWYQSNRHQNTKQSACRQHWHFCSGTMMTATNSWAGSSQVVKRGLPTLHQKPSSSQCIGVTVDLPARRYSSRLRRRGKWCAQCSGIDWAFSSSISWPEVRQWLLSVSSKHWRNCDGSFRRTGGRMFSAGVVLLHDNAGPHTARRSTHLLQELNWEVFNSSTLYLGPRA